MNLKFLDRCVSNTRRYKGVCCSVLCCTQSCPTLCDPMECSPPGFSDHRFFQARILEWLDVSYSRGSFPLRSRTCVTCVSCTDRQILYHCATQEVPQSKMLVSNNAELIQHIRRHLFRLRLLGLIFRKFETWNIVKRLIYLYYSRLLFWKSKPVIG